MNSGIITNDVFVFGKIVSEPNIRHTVCGVRIYVFSLKVLRFSGCADILPVHMPESMLCKHDIKLGDEIGIRGQFRSYNTTEDGRNRLILYIFAQALETSDDNEGENYVALSGVICKLPGYRITPRGREIADILIAVHRPKVRRSDYIPIIAWGINARFAQDLKVGDRVSIIGRLQSREYDKKLPDESVVTKTAYEVSAKFIQTSQTMLSVTEFWKVYLSGKEYLYGNDG